MTTKRGKSTGIFKKGVKQGNDIVTVIRLGNGRKLAIKQSIEVKISNPTPRKNKEQV